MRHDVQIFEIAKDAKPVERPRLVDRFAVSGDTTDEARRATLGRLLADGRTVRAISCLVDGGIAAVVLPREPALAPHGQTGSRSVP